MVRESYIVSKTAWMGQVSAKQIDDAIGNQISEDNILCTMRLVITPALQRKKV